MSKRYQILEILRFSWSRQKHVITAPFVAAAVLLVAACLSGSLDKANLWSVIERVLSLVTLAVAVVIWWGEQQEAWERSLPKRLTVSFVFNESGRSIEVMRCEKAYLAGEADIRAWGQQLGSQMALDHLQFFPNYQQESLPPKRDEDGRFYKDYRLTIQLREFPKQISQAGNPPYVLWTAPEFSDSRNHPAKPKATSNGGPETPLNPPSTAPSEIAGPAGPHQTRE